MNKIFSFVSVSCAIFVLAIGLFYIFTVIQKLELRSCVSHTTGDIAEYSKEICNFARGYESWYVLTDDEAKLIFSNQHIKFDKPFFSLPKDLKDRNPKIVVRGNKGGSCGVLVWSRGFDAVLGTDDDIVPLGEEIPK